MSTNPAYKIYKVRKGYEICVVETGKRLEGFGVRYYPTLEAAEAAYDEAVRIHEIYMARYAAAAVEQEAKQVVRDAATAIADEQVAREPLATDRQIAYAWDLICQRTRGGQAMHEGGFISGSYPTYKQLQQMTSRSISSLINSLRESY